ncbi:C3a anaphylatoxin chemotactic receptor [Ctenodactylus gundi]
MGNFSAETSSTSLLLQTGYQPETIISMVILGLTFLLGLPGNGLVLWVAGLKMQRTVSTVWFLHLTLADFLCCLSLPFSLAQLAVRGHWPYGWFMCKLLPSVVLLNMFASIFLLTAISLDRCVVVLKPIWCQNHRSVRTAHIICGVIWMVAFLMCTPVFVYREILTTDNNTICSYNFGPSNSYDYWDYTYFPDPVDQGSPNDSIKLPGETEGKLDSSSSQTHALPWATTPVLYSQISQKPSAHSLHVDLARLSTQHPYYGVHESADVISTQVANGFPIDNGLPDTLDNSDAFLSTDSDTSLHDSRNPFYIPEVTQEFQYDDLNQVPTPLVTITFTRLVAGFLMPSVIMVACYGLMVFRMRRDHFAKSRRKIFQVAVVVVTAFLVCWTPYHVFGVLSLLIDPFTPFGEAVLSWDRVSIALASANSCLNPFLYALLGKDFRKTARQSLKSMLEKAFNEEPTPSTGYTQSKVISGINDNSSSV